MITALLDTDIFIELLRGNSTVFNQVRNSRPQTIGVSMVTVFELRVGVEKSREPEKNHRYLQDTLAPFKVVPFDDPASLQAAKVRSYLQSKGTGIGPYDTLIAGQALSLNAKLITANSREFSRVPGLKWENWMAVS
jgi:tRNA(fMet)-specific endonuclease VapC